jgi:hypothetical protein
MIGEYTVMLLDDGSIELVYHGVKFRLTAQEATELFDWLLRCLDFIVSKKKQEGQV